MLERGAEECCEVVRERAVDGRLAHAGEEVGGGGGEEERGGQGSVAVDEGAEELHGGEQGAAGVARGVKVSGGELCEGRCGHGGRVGVESGHEGDEGVQEGGGHALGEQTRGPPVRTERAREFQREVCTRCFAAHMWGCHGRARR